MISNNTPSRARSFTAALASTLALLTMTGVVTAQDDPAPAPVEDEAGGTEQGDGPDVVVESEEDEPVRFEQTYQGYVVGYDEFNRLFMFETMHYGPLVFTGAEFDLAKGVAKQLFTSTEPGQLTTVNGQLANMKGPDRTFTHLFGGVKIHWATQIGTMLRIKFSVCGKTEIATFQLPHTDVKEVKADRWDTLNGVAVHLKKGDLVLPLFNPCNGQRIPNIVIRPN